MNDRTADAAKNPLKFAHELADFRSGLEEHIDGPDGLVADLAASYLHLLRRLAAIDCEPQQIIQAVAPAIEYYNRSRREAARRRYARATAGQPGPEQAQPPGEDR